MQSRSTVLIFVCLRKSFFLLYFWRIISEDTEFYFGVLASLNAWHISLHFLLDCMISEEKSDVILIFVPLCVCPLSHVWIFATPWTIALQAPLSMKFSRQECWIGLPLPTLRDFRPPRDGTRIFCVSCTLAGKLFSTMPLGKPSIDEVLFLLASFRIFLFTIFFFKLTCTWHFKIFFLFWFFSIWIQYA